MPTSSKMSSFSDRGEYRRTSNHRVGGLRLPTQLSINSSKSLTFHLPFSLINRYFHPAMSSMLPPLYFQFFPALLPLPVVADREAATKRKSVSALFPHSFPLRQLTSSTKGEV